MIVHLRVVPGFWVAVEEARRPELRSHPLIIGGLPQQRGIVREANEHAQRSGVRPGMTLSQAHQHCPQGIFLLPDLAHYERVWEDVCEILRRHTPLVEPLELGQAACDMSGCEQFRRDEWSAGRTVVRQIERSTGITPVLGMASNRLVAQLASLYPEADGVTVVERGQERAFLAALPLTLLPGIDPRLALTFQVLGLTTIGQFAALPASAVKQRFGRTGEQLHRHARGIDPRPVLPPAEKSSIVARYECEDGSIEEAMDGIRRLAATCAGELQARRVAGRLVGLTLSWAEAEIRLLPQRKAAAYLESDEPTSRSLPPGQPTHARPETERRALPIHYRVHSSRLPQPLEESAPNDALPIEPSLPVRRAGGAPPVSLQSRSDQTGRAQQVVAMVRTPIDTAPPLLDRAQRLLRQNWPPARAGEGHPAPRLLAIELKIGEFAKPSQLSLSELDRLDSGGMLKGLSTERRQALLQDDEAFEARYGTTAFHHVAGVDSGNILTERRFRWEAGLPWIQGALQKRS